MLENLRKLFASTGRHTLDIVNNDGTTGSVSATCEEINACTRSHFKMTDDGKGDWVRTVITCHEADAELNTLRNDVRWYTQALAASDEKNRVGAEKIDNHKRLDDQALLLAFRSGTQLAALFGTPMLGEPALASDHKSVVIDFDTLVVVVAPFVERVIITPRNSNQSHAYQIHNGLLSGEAQREILGLLELSRRESCTLEPTFSLAGSREVI